MGNNLTTLSTTLFVSQPSGTIINVNSDDECINKNINFAINVQEGNLSIDDITITANPIISIDNETGAITATTNAAQTVVPNFNAGWISNNTTGSITVSGTNNVLAKDLNPNLDKTNIKYGVTLFGVSGILSDEVIPLILEQDNDNFIELPTTIDQIAVPPLLFLDNFIEKGNTDMYSEINNSNITSIRNYCFAQCGLVSVSFPECTNIGSYAFAHCSSLVTISFPLCNHIGYSAFTYCSSLVTASFPECTNIGSYAFAFCSSLIIANFPECISVGGQVFRSCTSLISASFPKCTSIGYSTFYNCYSLTSIHLPECINIESYAFANCYSLSTASFPKCTNIGSGAFNSCSSLIAIYFSESPKINQYAFQNCSHLFTIQMLGQSPAILPQSNAFNGVYLSQSKNGRYCSIYVRASLISKWRSATNWTYFSSRFVGV